MVRDESPPLVVTVDNKVPMMATAGRWVGPEFSGMEISGPRHLTIRQFITIEWSLQSDRRWHWVHRRHRDVLSRPSLPRKHPKKPFGFSHTPPRWFLPDQRWRGVSDPQWFPIITTLHDVGDILRGSGFLSAKHRQTLKGLVTTLSDNRPSLKDVAVHLLEDAYLTVGEKAALCCVSTAFRFGSVGLPLWFSRPWQPFRRRQYGFGACHKDRSCQHDQVSLYLMLHFTWKLYTAEERHHAVQQLPVWRKYAQLRILAATRSVHSLKTRRSMEVPKHLCSDRSLLNGAALLRFDFNYGDFVRWLGGEYVNRDRQWEREWAHINSQF